MNSNLKYGMVALIALVFGIMLGRILWRPVPAHAEQSSDAHVFENEALGFVNWFRLNGRDEITKEVLVSNLLILESKAILSGKLIAFKGDQTKPEQEESSGGEKPVN